MMERKLAIIRKIEEIQPIEGLDKIVKARIGDWWVVTKLGEYKPGDLVVYISIKFRGHISQGLILPVFSDESGFYIHHIDGNIQNVSEGQDVTEALGIQKVGIAWSR